MKQDRSVLRTRLCDLLGCDVPILPGNLKAMALYAGQGAGRIRDVVPASVRLNRIADETVALLARQGSAADVERGTA